MPTPNKKIEPKRVPKTPAQRAQEALDVANRAVERLFVKVKAASETLRELQEDFAAAKTRQEYLAQNPDLPSSDDSDTQVGDA